MTNLATLRVSLTKHGAHKIAILLKNLPANELLDNLQGTVQNIHIDRIQAQKNVSAQGGRVPAVWSDIKAMGDDAIDSMVLLAIIFSHEKLIKAMARSATGAFTGTILRNQYLTGKEYTNFVHTIEELNFSTTHDSDNISYNLARLIDPKYGRIAKKIFNLKLYDAGWTGLNSVEDEIINLGFHNSLSITEQEMRSWLKGTTSQINIASAVLPIEDEDFFYGTTDANATSPFRFVAGHMQRPEGTIDVSIPKDKITAELLHNRIQNDLYLFLEKTYGKGSTGTEVPTGDGTSVDVALKKGEELWFYEIKTARTVKATIRQALPQLIEYAYWPDKNKAARLIIVSHLPATALTELYLETLRIRFGIPIHYQQFCLDSKTLITS